MNVNSRRMEQTLVSAVLKGQGNNYEEKYRFFNQNNKRDFT